MLSEFSINQFSSFDQEKELWANDIRYKVLPNENDKRNAFENFIQIAQFESFAPKAKLTPKQTFFQLLDANHPKIHAKSTFRDVQLRCAKDRRWDKIKKSADRIRFFREWCINKKTAGKLDEVKDSFRALLEELKAENFPSWEAFKSEAKNDPRYTGVPSLAQRMAYYNEYRKSFETANTAIEKRKNKVAEMRRQIEERNAMFRNKANVSDASIVLDQILLDLYKHQATSFYKQNFIAKWEDVQADVSKEPRFAEACSKIDVRDCERIFNRHVEQVIRKARKMLQTLLDEKLPQGSTWKVDDEVWQGLWLQIKTDQRCQRLCGDSEDFAKNEFVRYQNDRFERTKNDLEQLFRETKLIDHKTKDKIDEQTKMKPEEKSQFLREIEDVLAFDSRWHAMKEDKLLRGKMLHEYLGKMKRLGAPAPITATKPKFKYLGE